MKCHLITKLQMISAVGDTKMTIVFDYHNVALFFAFSGSEKQKELRISVNINHLQKCFADYDEDIRVICDVTAGRRRLSLRFPGGKWIASCTETVNTSNISDIIPLTLCNPSQ